jgi:hypothetical protein
MGMTKSSLNPGQRRTVEIIEALGFGVVEGLLIRDGSPCFEPEPSVVQAIKLDSTPERSARRINADLTLKVEFERLFDELRQLHETVVDIEIRHRLPFRLVVKRRFEELL